MSISERTLQWWEISIVWLQKVRWSSDVLMLSWYCNSSLYKNAIPKSKKKHQSPAFHASGSWELHQKLPQQQTSTNESRVASRQNQNFVFMVLPLGLQTSITWCIRFSTACRKTEKNPWFFHQKRHGTTDQPIQRALQPSSKLDTSFLPMERTLVGKRKKKQDFLAEALPCSANFQMDPTG